MWSTSAREFHPAHRCGCLQAHNIVFETYWARDVLSALDLDEVPAHNRTPTLYFSYERLAQRVRGMTEFSLI